MLRVQEIICLQSCIFVNDNTHTYTGVIITVLILKQKFLFLFSWLLDVG